MPLRITHHPDPETGLTTRFHYLHDHLAESVTASDMAKVCHMSLSGFHRYFRRHTDASPINYLKRLRLNKAAQLLLSTDLTIAEVSDRTGFSNQFHFSREFKRVYRQSPAVYRSESYRAFPG